MMHYTTTSAAAYLAERGYTIKRRRIGGEGPPTADTIKHWCLKGKFPSAEKRGRDWYIAQEDLDRLIRSKSMKELTIAIDTSDESMVGGPGWENYDPQASVDTFLDLVLAQLQGAYPDHRVVLTPTTNRTRIAADDFGDDGEDAALIRHLINEVWERQTWYVQATTLPNARE